MNYYFQGLRFDGNSQDYNARNRDSDPSLGRWTRMDPAGHIDGLNLYLQEDSAPTTSIDPYGLWGWLSPGAYAVYWLAPWERSHYQAPDDDHATGDNILVEFFNSIGPTTRHFGQNAFMTGVIKSATAVNDARTTAMSQLQFGNTANVPIDQNGSNVLWDATRMLAGSLTGGSVGNMGFVGSYHGTLSITKKGPKTYNLHFHIYNVTSSKSGGGSGPDNRPVDQIWDWDEQVTLPPKCSYGE